jgi:hypothetical protein
MRYSKLDCEPVPHRLFEGWKGDLLSSFLGALIIVALISGVSGAWDYFKGTPVTLLRGRYFLYIICSTGLFYIFDLLEEWSSWKRETYSFQEMAVERFNRLARWAERSFVRLPKEPDPWDKWSTSGDADGGARP